MDGMFPMARLCHYRHRAGGFLFSSRVSVTDGLGGALHGSPKWSQAGGREGGRLWAGKGSIFSMLACMGLPFGFVLEAVDKNREEEEEGILEQWPLLS